jgi:hypothetical protein
MALLSTYRKITLRFGLLLVALTFFGCAGMEPYEPRDEREEGPKRGLLSGEAGEFVIIIKDR